MTTIYIQSASAFSLIWFLCVNDLDLYKAACELELRVKQENWKCQARALSILPEGLDAAIGNVAYHEKPDGFSLQVCYFFGHFDSHFEIILGSGHLRSIWRLGIILG